ncbi:MAG: hypothetical protein ABIJ31_15740 [Pseudomonadota bacterium]
MKTGALPKGVMEKPIQAKMIRSGLALLLAIGLFAVAGARVPVFEAKTDQYFYDAIKKAGVAYATCRVVNASVSILKESSLKLEPAGIGVSLALGQALDPIDDMTERLSDVLVTAITSLGVQKLIYEISLALVFPILAILLIFLAILIWFDNETVHRIRRILTGVVMIVVIVRITLPVSAIANAFIHAHFFDDRISAANTALFLGVQDLDTLKDVSLPEIDGLIGTIENSARFLKEKTHALNAAITTLTGNMGQIIETLLTLTFLYVGVFFIQVILLPVLTFWLLIKVANAFCIHEFCL